LESKAPPNLDDRNALVEEQHHSGPLRQSVRGRGAPDQVLKVGAFLRGQGNLYR